MLREKHKDVDGDPFSCWQRLKEKGELHVGHVSGDQTLPAATAEPVPPCEHAARLPRRMAPRAPLIREERVVRVMA